MVNNLDPLSHTLGRIENALETIVKAQAEDRRASAQYRTDMRHEMGEVKGKVETVANRLDNTVDKLAKIEPVIEDYKERRAEVRGISRLGHLVAALGGGSFALALQWLLRKFGG